MKNKISLGLILFLVSYNILFGINTIIFFAKLLPNFFADYNLLLAAAIYLACVGVVIKIWNRYIKI